MTRVECSITNDCHSRWQGDSGRQSRDVTLTVSHKVTRDSAPCGHVEMEKYTNEPNYKMIRLSCKLIFKKYIANFKNHGNRGRTAVSACQAGWAEANFRCHQRWPISVFFSSFMYFRLRTIFIKLYEGTYNFIRYRYSKLFKGLLWKYWEQITWISYKFVRQNLRC